MDVFLVNWIATIPNFATPLLLAGLGLILCERAGIINLGAEGMMAVGAMTAVIVAYEGGGPWLAILAGALAATALSVLFALAVVVFRADQVLSGLTVVALGAGITGVLGRSYMHQPITGIEKLDLGALSDIPVLGKILFQQDPLVYLTIVIVAAMWFGLSRTRSGLRLRAVGEEPATADVSGVDVQLYQFGAMLLAGAACGLAGAYLSIVSSQVWVEGMIAGRGWIAVALVIFARWDPLRAVLGAVIFGGAEALTPRLLAIGADVPVYLMNMLPYVVTLAILIFPYLWKRGESAAPSHLGAVYLRQDRH